jgi:hypothetical protein
MPPTLNLLQLSNDTKRSFELDRANGYSRMGSITKWQGSVLENLIHRVFDPAQLEMEIRDRFGNLVKPCEWFLVPLFVFNEMVERIRNGSITGYVYDPNAARNFQIKWKGQTPFVDLHTPAPDRGGRCLRGAAA